MKISLNDGLTYQDAPNGVRVVFEDIRVSDKYTSGELHIGLSYEGIVMDVWVTRVSDLDHNIGTHTTTVDELVIALVENAG